MEIKAYFNIKDQNIIPDLWNFIIGIWVTLMFILTLTACGSQYIIDSAVNIDSTGVKLSSKQFTFTDCTVNLEEYQGAVVIRLSQCKEAAYLLVHNGRDKIQRISGDDTYIFKKNDRVTFDLSRDGQSLTVIDRQIWPDESSPQPPPR